MLESLQREKPDRYGLLENNIKEVYDEVKSCDRCYPCSRNLYSEDTGLEENSFGQVLSQLEDLGVFTRMDNGSGSVNRYDFTELNRERLEIVYDELTDTD